MSNCENDISKLSHAKGVGRFSVTYFFTLNNIVIIVNQLNDEYAYFCYKQQNNRKEKTSKPPKYTRINSV